MTKKLRIVFITLLLVLISCCTIGTVWAKYVTKKEVGQFNINIAASFSGIVTSEDELATAKELKVDYTVQGGSYTSQILADGVTVTINQATIDYINPVSIKNGGTMVINDATVIGSDSTPPTIGVYSGSTLTINGGTFSGWTLLMGGSTSTVNIYGGTFDVELINGYGSMGIYEVGTVNIYGGTFAVDPSAYVADGYEAVKNEDNTWTVVCTHADTDTAWTTTPNTHSGTCERCKNQIDEKHVFDENGLCSVCAYKTIVSSTQLSEAVANGAGTADNPLIIGGGEWGGIGTYGDTTDNISNLYLVINDGTFNSDALFMYARGSTITIYGGTFTGTYLGFQADNIDITIYDGTFNLSYWVYADSTFSITIYGGKFNLDPTAYLAEGCTATQNTDGLWEVTNPNAS